MGEIAEDIVEGRCCADCGMYFDSGKKEIVDGKEVLIAAEHGYPVLCEDCWNESSKKQRKGYSKSLYPLL